MYEYQRHGPNTARELVLRHFYLHLDRAGQRQVRLPSFIENPASEIDNYRLVERHLEASEPASIHWHIRL